jgi:hypothetical protein
LIGFDKPSLKNSHILKRSILVLVLQWRSILLRSSVRKAKKRVGEGNRVKWGLLPVREGRWDDTVPLQLQENSIGGKTDELAKLIPFLPWCSTMMRKNVSY